MQTNITLYTSIGSTGTFLNKTKAV